MNPANCFAGSKLGSISSLRCQKSRTHVPKDATCEVMFRGRLSLAIECLGNQTIWWSQTGSNRRPHACKARALPTELWPLGSVGVVRSVAARRLVGPGRLELPTLRLSGVRSNQLSYGPIATPLVAPIKGIAPTLGSRSRQEPERPVAVRKEKRRRRRPAPE